MAGIDYRPLPALRLRATVFYNRLDDAIANVTTGIAAGVDHAPAPQSRRDRRRAGSSWRRR